MKTTPKHFTLLLLVLITACDPEQSQTGNTDKAEKQEEKTGNNATAGETEVQPFDSVYQQLQDGIKKQDALLLNGLVHPEYGTFIIETGGAVPYFVLVRNFGRYKSLSEDKGFFELANDSLPDYEEGKLPGIDCDNPPSFYTKSGIYMQPENRLLTTEIWKHAGLQEKMEKRAAEMIHTITVTVVNTKGFTYYFSSVKGKWYLMFIDMRQPCQA